MGGPYQVGDERRSLKKKEEGGQYIYRVLGRRPRRARRWDCRWWGGATLGACSPRVSGRLWWRAAARASTWPRAGDHHVTMMRPVSTNTMLIEPAVSASPRWPRGLLRTNSPPARHRTLREAVASHRAGSSTPPRLASSQRLHPTYHGVHVVAAVGLPGVRELDLGRRHVRRGRARFAAVTSGRAGGRGHTRRRELAPHGAMPCRSDASSRSAGCGGPARSLTHLDERARLVCVCANWPRTNAVTSWAAASATRNWSVGRAIFLAWSVCACRLGRAAGSRTSRAGARKVL